MSENTLDVNIGFKSGSVVSVKVTKPMFETILTLATDGTQGGYFEHDSGVLFVGVGQIEFVNFLKGVKS